MQMQADIGRKCKDVKPHEGRVQRCLRLHRAALDWGCREQLFRQAMENADDIRLSSTLFSVCLEDKKKVWVWTLNCGPPPYCSGRP